MTHTDADSALPDGRTASERAGGEPVGRERIGPRTKGLALDGPSSPAEVVAARPLVTGETFGWPLLTLDEEALEHNLRTMADVCRRAGVTHAPHVKTTMSREVFARQQAHGAWGATVANPAQLRTVVDWGARRVFLANELLDPRELRWLRTAVEQGAEGAQGGEGGRVARDEQHARPRVGEHDRPDQHDGLEVWLYVDSVRGVRLLADAFADAPAAVRAQVGVLVEVGVPGGRTGVREPAEALALGHAVATAGLRLVGVAGYEGSAASGTSPGDLDRVAAFCRTLRAVARLFVRDGLVAADGAPVVVSAGGSSFLDVVLAELPGDLLDEVRPGEQRTPVEVVVRSGAYVTHDHGFCERMDPWRRIPGAEPMRAAALVWAQVISTPEPGLAVLGAGRRDLAYDLDLPVALAVRRADDDGRLAPPQPLAGARVTALNDQHLFLAVDREAGGAEDGGTAVERSAASEAVAGRAAAEGTAPTMRPLAPGDVVGLGISHPCTLFDKWRVAAVVDAQDRVVELVATDF